MTPGCWTEVASGHMPAALSVHVGHGTWSLILLVQPCFAVVLVPKAKSVVRGISAHRSSQGLTGEG